MSPHSLSFGCDGGPEARAATARKDARTMRAARGIRVVILHEWAARCRLSVVSCRLSVVSCRLSVVDCREDGVSCLVLGQAIRNRQPRTDNREPTTENRQPDTQLTDNRQPGEAASHRVNFSTSASISGPNSD